MPFFKTRDGTCLAYEDHGSGPPIVLIPGSVGNEYPTAGHGL